MSETPMLRQYQEIKQRYPDAILFFRLGDFYEMFGEDAKRASAVLEITLTSRDGGGDTRIPMCGVPHHASQTYLTRLVQHGFKVAICEQLEDPKQAKGVVKRDVVRVVTPGTCLEGSTDDKQNTYLAAIVEERGAYGLAFVDLSTGEFRVTRLATSEEARDELLRMQPAELLVPKGRDELVLLAAGLDTVVTETEPRLWHLEQAKHCLVDHFQVHSLEPFGLTERATTVAAGAAFRYVADTQQTALAHIGHISYYSLDQFLHIDANSQRNLELVRTIRDGRRQGSLLGVLDYTVTNQGGRLLRQWLEKPLITADAIRERQQAIGFLINNSLIQMELVDLLGDVQDLERLLSRLLYGSGNARDLIALKTSLQQIPAVKALFADDIPSLLCHIVGDLDELLELTQLIEEAIVDEPPVSVKEGGLIRSGFDEELDELRQASGEGKQWIADLQLAERERTGIRSLKVGFNKVFGYYLEVTKANIDGVPDNYQRKQTLANAERFITPELKEKEAVVLGAQERMADLEYRLFSTVRARVGQHIEAIQTTARAIAMLDVIQSLGQAAVKHNYSCPQLTDQPELQVEDGRHPVIEVMQPNFVPNDLMLHGNQRIVLLTGPNMAGKSTYLRQNALIVVMAQIGSYVPAKRALVGITDRIFTRIGAADDLSTGQSTFMVECQETAHLLLHSTERSLIVLDELGRGTSTFDGMAIAQAVMEHLHDQIRARTLFSTHYHELVALENELAALATYRMDVEESRGKVIFLHRVSRGSADRSYGINVAKMAGVPKSITKRARNLLHKLEASQDRPLQLDLFTSAANQSTEPESDGELLLEDIRAVSINDITPLQALELIARWQRELERDGHG